MKENEEISISQWNEEAILAVNREMKVISESEATAEEARAKYRLCLREWS